MRVIEVGLDARTRLRLKEDYENVFVLEKGEGRSKMGKILLGDCLIGMPIKRWDREGAFQKTRKEAPLSSVK